MLRSLLQVSLLLLGLSQIVVSSRSNPPKGFATTHNDRFEVDGKEFYFVGANSYWLPLLTSKEDVKSTLKEMKDAGVKVLRTWGFNAINSTELEGANQSGLTYYQVWNSSEWVLNDGPQGLQRLDYVLEQAAANDIKVILTFTNNWSAYGGMELYVSWIAGAGATHDVFFTDPRIRQSYQRYVKTLVERYKDSPTIFAWELMNEARCLGDIPGGPNCVPGSGTLTKWYNEQADFVRSLDPHHMITTGGEGHFYWKEAKWASDYNFNGQAGEDFDTDLALENIDFGTYHMYPQYWYSNVDFPGSNFSVENWGLVWINYHAQAAKKANKPLILEEFGMTGLKNKTDIYPAWVKLALDTKHAGIMPWQFGMLGLQENGGNRHIKYADALIDGASPNDQHTYYKNQTDVWRIFTEAAKAQADRSK